MNNSEAGPSTRVTEDFDVFLNHRGPDTKATFISHLYSALKLKGFQPFFDRESLEVGNHNHESIHQALDIAKVHVVVVSKGYAESKYCLDELVAIMNSAKPVIPMFYGVEPYDLLDVEKGKFAEAFEHHKKRQTSPKKLQEWTNALGWLSKIVGPRFDTTCKDCNEAKLVQEVVNAVTSKCPRALGFVDENRRIGLEESKKEVIRKLESGRVGVVGLYGMGGIGKTTLAEAVYEYCAQGFGHRSFLRDVRSRDPLTLQNQIMKDIRGMKVSSHEEYRKEFFKFNNLKVLIVVDDIDNERQFQDIIPDVGQIGQGSRIIVTSRSERVLSNVLISTPQLDIAATQRRVLHEIQQLTGKESQQLFNIQAFLSESPDSGFEDLAKKVADACGGHPLALELAGAFLRNKKDLETDRELWDEMIASKATRDETLQSILRKSFDDGLDNCQKTMFLDISCHLIGEPSAVALEIWASCKSCGCVIRGEVRSRLRDLTEKCLVKLDTDGRLRMHDVLRDMGRKIVEDAVVVGGFKKWERTHLWHPEDAHSVLEDRKGSDKVRGFSRTCYTSTPTYFAKAFSKMSELHLLVLDGCRVFGDFSKWSRELRLLRWRFFPLPELPLELNLAKTAMVDLSGSDKLKRLWKEKRVDLNGNSQLKCHQRDKTPLKKTCFLWRWLILNDCTTLTMLPEDIGHRLPKLKVLELERCFMLESLPNSIGEMKDLERLILPSCGNLRSIPNTIGWLKKLTHLDLSHCHKLEILPDAIVNLGTLTALTTLKMKCNPLIKELPENFMGLTSLVRLKINMCPLLRTVNALPHSLRHLDLGNCRILDCLPSFKGLTLLATLTLCNCASLKKIQGLDGLTTLEEVNLTGCKSIQPSTLQLQHNRAMRSCCLSGSNVAVKYDSDWSESEPAVQLITYYDDAFGFIDDGLNHRVFKEEDCHEVCMMATIESKTKCVAVVICCVAHDQGWSNDKWKHKGYCRSECFLDAWIVRNGQEVFRSQMLITLKHADDRNQVYLCTLRRTHPLVRELKYKDQIQVAARSRYPKWAITVECGAICVVHGDDKDQVLSVNSRLLDVQQSQEKRARFAGLILADNHSEREKWAKFALSILADNQNCSKFSKSANGKRWAKFARLI